ncbi:DUF349 domain-containing protein [uncultured Rikenella sp.]|uniref:DUF349 domain-containing protein n=1 Tax=uncultured Rikenella sp. TaxID=368003 RepID=UPI0026262705|nr:DUF349 domain-containing protein [uncultured Rikenella sp.]
MESQGLSSAQAPAEIGKEQFDTVESPQEEAVAVDSTETEIVETAQDTTPAAGTTEPAAETENAAQSANPYAGKDQAELIDLLAKMLEERPVQNLRGDVEAVKIAFYKAGRAKIEAQRAAFIADGGAPEEFKPAGNENEARFKELLLRYREKRDAFVNRAEQEKERAYAAKLQIIEELKELVNGNETLGQTFNTFRELQQRWKDAGLVPQEKIKDLWETYHHHVENFYNYIKINKELRDLDLKKNYEAKTELAEEAEALMLEPSATDAFHKLQKLHDQWREIGPVAPEFKDTLWERFKAASTQINKRHQEYFEGLKAEQKQNLTLKTELCEKVEELAGSTFTSHKEWNAASEQIIEIQKVWKTIGFAPKKDNTQIYERFRAACDKFFEAKRAFYQGMKVEIADNLQAKLDLCVQAEALQDSEDWKATTDALIALQKRWKEIGATSRKHSEQVWKRFRAASDRFFTRKAEHFGNQDSQYAENLTRKESLLDEMRKRLQEKANITFDAIKEYQRRWAEIGFVPIKKKEAIQTEYRRVVDGLFDLLRGEERERHIRNFRDKVAQIQESGSRRLSMERDRLYNKIRQIEGDIQIWENNIGFFAKSKNAEALMREVQNKIARAKEQIATLTEKIRLIDHPEPAPAPKIGKETEPEPEKTAGAEPVAEKTEEPTTTNSTEQE